MLHVTFDSQLQYNFLLQAAYIYFLVSDVLQVSCITNVLQTSLLFRQLLFIYYSICGHTFVSHYSLNFDTQSVGYGFSFIILVL